MNLESLEFETKVAAPTQQLLHQVYAQLGSLYLQLREALIDFHTVIAIASKQLYDQPVETTKLWYSQLADKSSELHARLMEQVIPEAQDNYDQFVASVSDFGSESKMAFQKLVDNPEEVTAQTIESLNMFVSETADITAEQLTELKARSADLIALLLEKPAATLDSLYTELPNSMLNTYFELVSSLLVTM